MKPGYDFCAVCSKEQLIVDMEPAGPNDELHCSFCYDKQIHIEHKALVNVLAWMGKDIRMDVIGAALDPQGPWHNYLQGE